MASTRPWPCSLPGTSPASTSSTTYRSPSGISTASRSTHRTDTTPGWRSRTTRPLSAEWSAACRSSHAGGSSSRRTPTHCSPGVRRIWSDCVGLCLRTPNGPRRLVTVGRRKSDVASPATSAGGRSSWSVGSAASRTPRPAARWCGVSGRWTRCRCRSEWSWSGPGRRDSKRPAWRPSVGITSCCSRRGTRWADRSTSRRASPAMRRPGTSSITCAPRSSAPASRSGPAWRQTPRRCSPKRRTR